MRIFVLACLLATSLAGCLGDDSPDDDVPGGSDGGDNPAAPAPMSYSCVADVGAVVVSASIGGSNIGGCPLIDLSGSRTVVESSPGESCTIEVDLDGDALADEEAVVGKQYKAGDSFTAFCQPPAVSQNNTIVLQ